MAQWDSHAAYMAGFVSSGQSSEDKAAMKLVAADLRKQGYRARLVENKRGGRITTAPSDWAVYTKPALPRKPLW
jgi:hypothetical protein